MGADRIYVYYFYNSENTDHFMFKLMFHVFLCQKRVERSLAKGSLGHFFRYGENKTERKLMWFSILSLHRIRF